MPIQRDLVHCFKHRGLTFERLYHHPEKQMYRFFTDNFEDYDYVDVGACPFGERLTKETKEKLIDELESAYLC